MLYSPCMPPCMLHTRMSSSPFFCQLCVAHRVWRRLLRQQLRALHCKRSSKQKPPLLRALLSHPFPQFLYFLLDSSYSRGGSHGDGNLGATWPKQQIYDDVTPPPSSLPTSFFSLHGRERSLNRDKENPWDLGSRKWEPSLLACHVSDLCHDSQHCFVSLKGL